MDEHNLKVFIVCTHSVVGALPLGIIITSDETTDTLAKAFNMYKSCLPEYAFFGKGEEGPSVFMTDNCSELRDALKAVWPSAVLLLCLLQQVWRWLCDTKNDIPMNDRQSLMASFKGLAYELNDDTFEEKYDTLIPHDSDDDEYESDEDDLPLSFHYPQFVSYLKDVVQLKKSWALCFRSELMLRNNAEAQFLVIKDKILQRIKEFNVISLMEKLVVDFDDHYKNKLLSVSSGSYDSFTARRFDGKSKKTGEIGYKVKQETFYYLQRADFLSLLQNSPFLARKLQIF